MYKGKLLKAIADLDPDSVAFCLDEEPDLLHTRLKGGAGLLQVTASVETMDADDEKTGRQIAIIDRLSTLGLDIHAVDETKDICDRVNLVWYVVARSRNLKLVQYLLSSGIKPDGLFAAVWWEDGPMIALLGWYGIDANQIVFNETPLMHCVRYGKFGALAPLIDIGADVNFQDDRGRSTLHVAIKRQVPMAVFKQLVKAGANPDLRGESGRSVRDIAARKRNSDWHAALSSVS